MLTGRKRVCDPFEGGLASRVYIATFPCFRSCYEIAKIVVHGDSAKNSSGRILKLADRFPEHFLVKVERLSGYKSRALITSKAQPFFSRLADACQLSPEEKELLKEFEPNFRKLMGMYLDLTLKRDPLYLKRDVRAFEELVGALCLTIYIASLFSQASTKTSTFSLSMLRSTLPGVLGISGVTNAEWMKLAEKLSKSASRQTLKELYTKARKVVPPTYEMAFTVLEGFEKYCKEFEKSMKESI